MNKISCIIPAYNEEKRILNVLRSVVGHELIGEVIVVNDGSTDNTQSLLEKESGIKLISYQKNRGKTGAVAEGIKQSQNDIISLIDADLMGLTHQNLTDLITPVLEGQADMSMSLRKNSLGIYRLMGIDFVSGERVFNKKIISNIEELESLSGYGLEVYLNRIVIRERLKIKIINWRNVSVMLKISKIGFWRGIKGEISMIKQIFSTAGFWEVVHQMIALRNQRV